MPTVRGELAAVVAFALFALVGAPVPEPVAASERASAGHAAASAPDAGPAGGVDKTIRALTAGNERHIAWRYGRPHQTMKRRVEVAQGQHPMAIIVGCSDSRVPPEIVFDRGLGDLFVIRSAGQVVDDVGLGSIEYAAEHLHVPLIVVLGHERCGAVDATLAGGDAPGHIGSLVEAIRPAVIEAKGQPGDALDNAVRAQVKSVVEQLSAAEPILSEMVAQGALRVIGARYDLDTGAVEFLPIDGASVVRR